MNSIIKSRVLDEAEYMLKTKNTISLYFWQKKKIKWKLIYEWIDIGNNTYL